LSGGGTTLTVQVAPLVLMAALTALMLSETVPSLARRIMPMLGVALLATAIVILTLLAP
jgi:hypothetical protein